MDVRTGDPATDRAAHSRRAVAEAGGRAHYVGGCVRDALLGNPAADLDIEVFGVPPDRLTELVRTVVPVRLVGASFGVLKAHGPARRRVVAPSGAQGRYRPPRLRDRRRPLPRRPQRRRPSRLHDQRHRLGPPRPAGSSTPSTAGRTSSGASCGTRATSSTRTRCGSCEGMHFVARFELTAAPETIARCRRIEPEGLAAERIFDEWQKLLLQGRGDLVGPGLPARAPAGWLHYPELAALVDCPQDPEWHPEGDVWVHTGHVMDCFAAERLGDAWEDLVVGFACLAHDFGKPATTVWKDGRWRSPGHEEAGLGPDPVVPRADDRPAPAGRRGRAAGGRPPQARPALRGRLVGRRRPPAGRPGRPSRPPRAGGRRRPARPAARARGTASPPGTGCCDRRASSRSWTRRRSRS